METAAVAAAASAAARGRARKAAEEGHSHDGDCANCGATLGGRYCHACGQDSDPHHRSIWHLVWEATEGLFHLDGRLWRTIPALFVSPGRLAKDYMDGRVARHTPPFRTFLVALLIFIFAAENLTHRLTEHDAERKAAEAAALKTPQGRAAAAAKLRADAARERAEELAGAGTDRTDDLKDRDMNPAKVEARYARRIAWVESRYAYDLAKADAVANDRPPPPPRPHRTTGSLAWLRPALEKATATPEYYWSILFTWGHRLAILLLPIVGLSLALAYRNKPQIYLYDHLLVAMSLLSFGFVANAVCLLFPFSVMPWALSLVALWTPVNLFQTLRGGYGSSVLGAAAKTLLVWTITVTAFGLLLMGLLVFALTQL